MTEYWPLGGRVQMPCHCGENDCPVGWHLYSFEIEGGVYDTDLQKMVADGDDVPCYYIVDESGNSEGIGEEDYPTELEMEIAWKEYYEDVVCTGRDPLRNFWVSRSITIKQHWSVLLAKGRGDYGVVKQVRLEGEDVPLDLLPRRVREYLLLDQWPGENPLPDEPGAMRGDWAELLACVGHEGWHDFEIDFKQPRPDEVVAEEIREAARKVLKSSKELIEQLQDE